MAIARTPAANLARSLSPDALIELLELDWSRLVGDPIGTEENIRRFAADVHPDGTSIQLGGKTYDPIAIRTRNFELSVDLAKQRPSITIGNANSLVSDLIRSIGDIAGAQVTRRRLFRRHLDDGDEPDPLAQWPEEVWLVERLVRENRLFIELELSSKIDVQNVEIPLRRIEPNHCQFLYKGPECTWAGGPPYFDADDNASSEEDDDCSLRVQGCKLRFGNAPLPFGGFPGSRRNLR